MARRKKFRKSAMLKGGFKCDAEGCDYCEETPMEFEYLDEFFAHLVSYLDKKCPKCGAPLLIQKDLYQFVALALLLHNPIFIALENILGFFNLCKKKLVHVGVDKEHNLEMKVEG